jgi:hypothetical protein
MNPKFALVAKKSAYVAAALLVLSITRCAEQKFSGESSKRSAEQKPKPTPKPTLPDPPVKPVEAGCVEARLLSVRSLVSFVDQSKIPRSVDVELTFEPCANQKGDLLLPILFDLDATLNIQNPLGNVIEYRLSAEQSAASSGKMNYVDGSDLFGKSGPKWGHFESSSPLTASPKFTKAILKLDLSTVLFYGPSNGPTQTTNFQVPLNVKIGASAPVLGTITLTPAPKS